MHSKKEFCINASSLSYFPLEILVFAEKKAQEQIVFIFNKQERNNV